MGLSLMHAYGKTGVVDKEEANKWLRIAADGGAVKALMFLAQMYTFGQGGCKKDEALAFEYLTRAADQGNVHATHQLGVRYLRRGRRAGPGQGDRAVRQGHRARLDGRREGQGDRAQEEGSKYRAVS